jgi:NADH-quinone oxidoreductase subunit N
LLLAGFALLLVGLGFKVAAVPFHAWTPDVYEGAPSPSVAYMASGVKAAGFAGMLRVFDVAFIGYRADWRPVVYILAVATLVVGSVLAIVQTDLKRMLAYSSISHAGFILIGVQAGTLNGMAGALFYLAAYTFLVAGSFGVVSVLPRDEDGNHSITLLQGFSRREPLLAFVFTVFLLGQLGVPLTSGFFAKFYVLAAAVDAGAWPLAVTAMITAVVSAFLYLGIVLRMYGDPPEDAPARTARLRVGFPARLAIGLAFVFTVGIGFLPGPVADMSKDATPVNPAGPTSRDARPPSGAASAPTPP